MKSASSAFSISKEATSVLQEAIQTGEEINIAEHTTKCRATVRNAIKKKEEAQNQLSSQLLLELPAGQRRTLHRIVKGDASGWLTVLPLREEGYDMSATQFQDQLAIRYHHEPSGLPASCDGRGAPFSLQHGLDCAKGGLVKKATMIFVTVMPELLMWLGEGWPLSPFLYQRTTKKVHQCYRLTGW